MGTFLDSARQKVSKILFQKYKIEINTEDISFVGKNWVFGVDYEGETYLVKIRPGGKFYCRKIKWKK